MEEIESMMKTFVNQYANTEFDAQELYLDFV